MATLWTATLWTASSKLFDWLEQRWESITGQRLIADVLVLSFIGGVLLIEGARQGWYASLLGVAIPRNHFYAVDFTLKLLLVVELAGLIFGLAHSVANAVGKQIEILSLILLRETFKEFTHFDEPITWGQVEGVLLPMLADATGALVIFVLVGFYYRVQRHRPITDNAGNLASFVVAKKLIALGLLVAFGLTGVYTLEQFWLAGREVNFFDACYTILIFADVLLVLVSLRYASTYAVVFRNSGFAIATVLIRLALIAPPPVNALLGTGSALFALGLSIAYNTFAVQMTMGAQHAPPPAPTPAPTPAVSPLRPARD
jgi:hypothetical protein